MPDHNYFDDPDDNNEVDAMRAACRVMSEHNLFMLAQRTLILASITQEIMKARFPRLWKEFNSNVEYGKPK